MLAILVLTLFFTSSCYGMDFTHHIFLDPNERYEMWWKFNDKEITVKVRVETRGWIGWGVSPNGNMVGSDIVLAWFDSDGKGIIQDAYAEGKIRPVADKNQNIHLIEMKKDGSNITVTFKRKLKLCDDDDRSITEDTMRVVYAYGDSQTPSYHGNKRSSHSLYLLDYGDKHASNELPPNTVTYEFRMSETIPLTSKDTQYICAAFKFRNMTGKHHLIRVEPIIKKGHENLVHHILLYECRGFNNESHLGVQDLCSSPNMPEHMRRCRQIVVHAWAIGGGKFDYPNETGLPFGRPEDAKYFFLEIHYDNPKNTPNIRDNSGLRLYFTKTLRRYDAAVLTAGSAVQNYAIIIPQNETEFKWTGFCSSKCLSIENENRPKVFATFLHSHLQGRKLVARLIRDSDGVEVKRINQDLNYDFNYQEIKYVQNVLEIPAGHSIHVECNYTTKYRSSPVVGGESTREEMCLAFIWHYPPIDNEWCTSINIPGFGQFQYNELRWNMTNSGTILQSVVLHGEEYLGKPAWKTLTNRGFWEIKSDLAEKWQKIQELPSYLQVCRSSSGSVNLGVIQPNLNQTIPTEKCFRQTSKGETVAKPFYITMMFSLFFLFAN